MLHLSFGHSFAELVALILLPGLALYFLNKKKASARRNEEDAGTGAPGSMTTPTEANSDGSTSLPTETNNGACSSPPTSTNSSGSSSSPTETKSGGSSPSPTGISKGASSSSPTETNNSASSSLTTTTGNRYEVFLSFRGPDTRYGFTSHLYKGLHDAGINTFRDDDDNELCQGEDIGPKLTEAITNCQILIPILSVCYGTSSWCLNELAQIIKCKNDNGQMVLPVFYKVKPSDVGHQRGSFGDAFHEREKRLLERPSFDPTILEKWKKALGEVSALKGYEADGSEADLVKSIVGKVLSELKKKFELDIPENLVGIDHHVKEIMEFVDTKKSYATLFVGIHGMGGIGKTTLAKAIYNEIFNQFEHRSFIADIRELWKRNGGHSLQNKLIYDILKRENEVRDENEGTKFIPSKFKDKKVLLLLDDVDDVGQLKRLAGHPMAGIHDWFSSGSMIIITTRNKRILDEFGVDYAYDHKEMDNDQSLILFSKHAFQRSSPPRDFEELTRAVVSTTGGLPLTLEVLGSLLFKRELAFWRDTIDKSKKVPPQKVQEKLRISYEVLEYRQKQIFLDIACFFIGTNRRTVSYMWDACGFFPEEGIKVLTSMSLIKVGDDHKLRMHDQLRDLGREIVCEENQREPENRSRLWDFKEVKKVLKKNKGTGKIEAIDLSEGSSKGVGKIVERDDNIYTGEQFKNLTSLRFLRMEEGAHLTGDFKDSVEELKWLQWENCPMNFVVNNFHATELVVLELRRGMINDGWEGWSSFKMAEKLKFLDLTDCQYLENTDSLSAFKNLEVLILNNCRRLQQIDSSIGGMKALLRLELRACKSLTKLPEEIGELKALEQLYLQDTSELSALPESIGSLPKLEILNVSQSGIEELPDNIGRLGKLRVLYAIRCFELGGKLPESMGSLQNLEEMERAHLTGDFVDSMQELERLPREECPVSFHPTELVKLDLSGSKINERWQGWNSFVMAKKLKFLDLGGCRYLKTTAFLSAFKSLEVLNLFGCSRLQQIDSSIGGMKALLRLDLSYCESLTKLPEEIGELKALEQLCLYKTPKLSALPESIGSLQNLEILIISHSGIEELPDGIGRLKKLRQLDASNCKNLKGEMPESMGSLESLEILDISCTGIEELPRGIGRLRKLRKLRASNCENLKGERRESMCNLSSLQRLDFRGCKGLQSLPDLPSSLTYLGVTCQSRKLPSLSHLTRLKELEVSYCHFLECIQELPSTPLKNSECSQPTGVEESELPQSLNTPFKLEDLEVTFCESIKILDVSQFIHLRTLSVYRCWNLLEVRGLDRLKYLESLTVTCCNSVERLELSKSKGLKVVNVQNCKNLVEIQGLDCSENLCINLCASIERLDLPKSGSMKILRATECAKLTEIQGLDRLEFLEHLYISGCSSIERLDLPKSRSMKILHTARCTKLAKIQGLDRLEFLISLSFSRCASIERLNLPKSNSLKYLHAEYCKSLVEIRGLDRLQFLEVLHIPCCTSIERLNLPKSNSLKNLNAEDCKSLVEIQGLDRLQFLEELNISCCTSIERLNLPKSDSLRNLNAGGCESLVKIRGLGSLKFLEALNLSCCTSIERLNLPKSDSLKNLNAEQCESLVEIQGLDRLQFLEELNISRCASIERLNLPKSDSLKNLNAGGCESLVKIRGLGSLKFLEALNLSWWTSLEKLPNLCCFDYLTSLTINRCDKLQDIQSQGRFPSCKILRIEGCKSLAKLPNLSSFHDLRELFLSNCHELREIPGLEESISLERITISGCSSIEILSDLSSCTRLMSLIVPDCEKLTEIRGLEKLEQLAEMDISGCKSLKTIPELSGRKLYQNYERKPSFYVDGIEFG